jgi:hypothetical protein
MGGMMVKEAIMPLGSQPFMAAEELPDEIKRRLPDAANVSTQRAPPHRGERLRADGFCDNLTIHRKVRSLFFQFGYPFTLIKGYPRGRARPNYLKLLISDVAGHMAAGQCELFPIA